jgi:sortase A
VRALGPMGLWALRILLAGLTVAGFAWGFLRLGEPTTHAWAFSPSATDTLAPTGAALPQAWFSPTRHIPSATPSATATFTPLPPTATTTASPLPTATATLTPSPTATPTPIHKPADGDPTRITIPAIGVDAKVVTVGIVEQVVDGVKQKVWEVADYAAGFHGGMARPGHVGNTVISGHNNIRGEVFRDLSKLKPGDDIYLWVGPSPYRYKVSVVYRLPVKDAPPEVLERNLRWILPTDDQRLTLVSCWPYWSNTHRIVVVAFPVPWEP